MGQFGGDCGGAVAGAAVRAPGGNAARTAALTGDAWDRAGKRCGRRGADNAMIHKRAMRRNKGREGGDDRRRSWPRLTDAGIGRVAWRCPPRGFGGDEPAGNGWGAAAHPCGAARFTAARTRRWSANRQRMGDNRAQEKGGHEAPLSLSDCPSRCQAKLSDALVARMLLLRRRMV